MKYPALDVTGVEDHDLILALVDDFSPAAVTDLDRLLTIFFVTPIDRDHAHAAIVHAFPLADARAHEVDDEDWARRSQENLTPVVVGRLVVTPPWHADRVLAAAAETAGEQVIIVIAPSMGFGTGHHATTRLCLQALQRLELDDRVALDVGTGSGVLAIAACLLGARESTGIDSDPDAIQAANENRALNPAAAHVRFAVTELRQASLPVSDIVVANLTGALLVSAASRLRAAVARHGTLIVSGLQTAERQDVLDAFAPEQPAWEAEEDGWLVLVLNRGGPEAV